MYIEKSWYWNTLVDQKYPYVGIYRNITTKHNNEHTLFTLWRVLDQLFSI